MKLNKNIGIHGFENRHERIRYKLEACPFCGKRVKASTMSTFRGERKCEVCLMSDYDPAVNPVERYQLNIHGHMHRNQNVQSIERQCAVGGRFHGCG